jgi:hypothetical protein
MWGKGQISFDLRETEGSICIVRIDTPAGAIELIGEVIKVGRVLHVNGAHAQGLTPGRLGRAGLNAIGRKLLEEDDVEEIIIQGGARTTGARPNRIPPAYRFPHRKGPSSTD